MTFDQKAYNRAYYLRNKERLDAQAREWGKANPEKRREAVLKYDAANRDKAREYYERNKDKIRGRVKTHSERNSASVFIKRRIWAGEVPAGCSPPWLTNEQLDAMQWFYDEARRLTKETGVRHVVDHIEPLNGAHSCGLHVPWNLQVLTDAANKRKRFREDRNY